MLALHHDCVSSENKPIPQTVSRDLELPWSSYRKRSRGRTPNHRPPNHRTPNQLFTAGSLNLQRSGLPAVDFFNYVPESYGISEEGLAPDLDGEGVVVPSIAVSATEEQMHQLDSVNPCEDSDDHGTSLYIRALQIIESWVT